MTTQSNVSESKAIDSAVSSIKEILESYLELRDLAMATELTEIMRQAVACDIFVCESFFNIMTTGGGGTIPHHHVKEYDRHLDIGKQKYSLVYYLSVGDQNCSEPGVLTLSKPDEKIIPNNGMVVIIPAIRPHFATYNGMQDRVMVGANFYAINT